VALTHHLDDRNSPVRRFLEDRFPILEESKRGSLLAPMLQGVVGYSSLPRTSIVKSPASSGYAGLIGTAVDYRLRYYFEAYDHRATVAVKGANLLRSIPVNPEDPFDVPKNFEIPRAAELADKFFKMHHNAVQKIKPVERRLALAEEDDLARHCLILAYYEHVFRAGIARNANSPLLQLPKNATLDDLLAIAKPECVEDVRQLSWAFYDHQTQLIGLPATLNPSFEGSAVIGGADADFLFGPTLVEIKTVASPDPGRMRETIYQLLGYTLLDYSDVYEIRNIAILWTRQNYLWNRPIWFFTHPLASVAKVESEQIEPADADVAARLAEMRTAFKSIVARAGRPARVH